MNKPTIDPCADHVRPHHCIKHIPEWPDNGPQMEQLRRDMQDPGLCAPIQLTPKLELVDPDSRERWRAARALQLTEIPVHWVAETDVELALIHTLCHRKHLTKSALAYLVYPVLEPALEQLRKIKRNQYSKGEIEESLLRRLSKTVADYADQIGIGRNLIFEAKKVHDIFAENPAYKAQMEPRLLAQPIGGEHEQFRPVGLGAIVAGWHGKKNEDRPLARSPQLELFTGAVGNVFKRFVYWTQMEPAQRRAAFEQIEGYLDRMEGKDREALADMLLALAKRAREKTHA